LKAIAYTKYGSPDVLSLRDVDKPVPKPDQVLVKMRAASINSWDWDMVRGKPWIVRIWGLTGPRNTIPGADIAGVVESVGSRVTKFKPGDEVFGDLCESGWGAYAEYAAAHEKVFQRKPPGMTFEEAAAIPQAGLMALQGLVDMGKVKKGQKVLMNGAGGGVGTFVIQIARSVGADVAAVDSGDKLDFLQALGANRVIDYTKEDFTRNGVQYDLIIDVVASRSLYDYKRALNNTGQLIIIGGKMSILFGTLLQRTWMSSKDGRQFGMLPYRVNDGLDRMVELFETRQARPVVDRTFTLEKTSEAFEYFASGKFKGKVVITMPG